MQIFKYNIKQLVLLATIVPITIYSCKKVEEPGEFNPTRQFTPVNVKVTSGETQAKLEWNPSLFSKAGETKYRVEIMVDSTIESPAVYSTEVASPVVTITDD